MKKIAVLFVSIWLMTMAVIAQTPQAFKYQAVARNSTGNLIQNQLVAFRISILQDSPSGTLLYQERHTTNTNNYGLANLNIGNGTVLSGIFSSIDWSLGQMYIKVELDPLGGTVYQNMGTTQLLSVPFALHSNSSTGLTLPFEGTALTAEQDSYAFKVSNSGTATGSAAITGHATATTGLTRGIIGQSDSPNGRGVQGYASNTTGSAFGVAGFTNSNGAAGVYGSATSSTGATSGVEGYSGSTQGTGVKGYAGTSTGTTFGVYGHSASNQGTGVFGFASAPTGSTYGVEGRSSSPSGVGVFGTSDATTGSAWGIFGSSGSTSGRAIGARAYSSTGTTFGIHSQVISNDGFSGYFTGGKFYVSGNVGIGTENPASKVHIQASSAGDIIRITHPTTNNYLFRFRQSTINGSGAFYVYDDAGNDQIFLFAEGDSYINGGNLGVGTTSPTEKLHVVGNVRVSSIGSGVYWGPVNRSFDGTFTTSTSDIRLKENIKTLNGGLDKVLQLRGVTFTWKSNPEYGNRIGFIAQEMEQVLPELVFTNDVDGYKGVNYAEVTAVLVEAIKDLKAENDRMKIENEKMNARIERLEASMNLSAGK